VERGRTGDHGLHQLMEQALWRDVAAYLRMREQRLDLRSEHQLVAGVRPEQRLHAEAVAYQRESIGFTVVQRERELAAQVLERALKPVPLCELEDQLAVALRAKAMTARGEVCAQSPVVVEFAVTHREKPAVARAERLACALSVEVDDRQPHVAEPDAAVIEGPRVVAVGPAVVLD